MKHVSVLCGLILTALLIFSACQTPNPAPTPAASITGSTTLSPSATASPAPTLPPGVNLLINPGFEGGIYQTSPELIVPLGWHVWSDCPPGALHAELEAHPPHVRSGSFSARLWQSYRTCRMVLWQRLEVLPGALYELAGWGFSWSTSNPVVGTPSEAYVKAWAGIDPEGGTNPESPSVLWGPENAARDVYGFFAAAAWARGPYLTVFLCSKPDWGLARSDTFWDDVALYEISLPTPDGAPEGLLVALAATPSPAIIEVTPFSLGGCR